MKTYRITTKLNITTKEGYNEATVAESEVVQSLCIPARDVRKAATEIVKQAVSNLSLSAESGLKQLIAEEPVEVDTLKEKNDLEV